MASLSLRTHEELHLNLLSGDWNLENLGNQGQEKENKKDVRKLKTKVILIQSKIDYQISDVLILRKKEVQ